MKTVELGRTGVQVSQLSLGCMLMGTRTDEPTSVQMLDRYLDAGGSFLDTANCYCWWHDRGSYGGHSEGGSVNVWSDWDEPPYGPGGRIVHRGFRRMLTGPVYGEVVRPVSSIQAAREALRLPVTGSSRTSP
jgi:hypothetical protein